MFFSKTQQAANVKKVSDIVSSNVLKEKKYISLMVVPSAGKTRSVHIPRTVFWGALGAFFAVTALVAGFYLRGVHLENMAQRLEVSIAETKGDFEEYREMSAQTQLDLRNQSHRAYERLNMGQTEVSDELARLAAGHRDAFSQTQLYIHVLEQQVQDLENSRIALLYRLNEKSRMIPQISSTVLRLNRTQQSLVEELSEERVAPPTFQLLGALAPTTEAELIARVEHLGNELVVQRRLLENIESYTLQIDDYLRNFPTLMPIAGGRITSGFGNRADPFHGRLAFHHGVDVPAPSGTPIMAAGGGTVVFVGWRNGFGYVVEIDHGFGLVTRYAHNSLNAAEEGQRVVRGEIIAYVGSTGRAISPHLHYEVILNGLRVDPIPYIWE